MKRRFVDRDGAAVTLVSAGASGPHHLDAGDGAASAMAGSIRRAGNGDLLVERDGVVQRVRVTATGDALWADRGGVRLHLQRQEQQRGGGAATGSAVTSPMTGRVVLLNVAVGDAVEKGQTLVVLEAMKMEQPLTAPRDGVVAKVGCEVGQLVDGGVVLVALEPEAQA